MGEVLGRSLAYFVLFTGAIYLGFLVRKVSNWRDVRSLGAVADRSDLMADVRRMRAEGASLQESIAYLRGKGLRKGVAQGMVLDVDREEPADVAHPIAGRWGDFEFTYPSNWRVTELVPELGEAGGISIEALGGAMVLIVPLAGDLTFEDVAREQASQLSRPEQQAITRWGPFTGEGLSFRGPHAKLRFEVELTVFRPDVKGCVLVEYLTIDEQELQKPGLELIRSSLVQRS